ncbi:MAG: NRAMP family divalent metal transporter [Acidimicrobiales bacterium]
MDHRRRSRVASPPPVPGAAASSATHSRGARALTLLAVVGPGLMVMLADTDAGSVVTAAQSGARFRFALVVPELALIPVLYLVQEMTVRLGLVTGRGHGALIRQTFGRPWALLSAATLFVACLGALVTEFAGVAGVGLLVDVPRWLSIGTVSAALLALILLGRYRRVEHVGIAIGALELLFLPAALAAHPHLGAVVHDVIHPWRAAAGYPTLLAANVGAVIMPWMIFYQQGAVIDKGRQGRPLRAVVRSSRLDTAVGAVVTQVVMIAVVVAVGATLGVSQPGRSLANVGAIAAALTPFLGRAGAVSLFGLGLVGAAVVATLVASLAGAWGVAEVLGWRHSLNDAPGRAVGFYALAAAGVVAGAGLVLVAPDLVTLSVDIEVLNACLLPVVLGFLLALEGRLPAPWRMRGARRLATYAVSGLVIVVGLATAAATLARVV